MSLIITGANGFVGSYALPLLAKNFKKIYALVRPKSLETARNRWSHLKNVELISGDLTLPGVLHDSLKSEGLFSEVTDVLHMGALYDLEASSAASYLANVVGTQNILDLAGQIPSLKRFHHVSTIAIAGDFRGQMKETMFNVGQRFSNAYAQTKYRSEGLIGSWKREDVKRLVYRLGVVVGDSQSGEMPKTDGPYYLLSSLRRNHTLWKSLAQLPRLPMPFDPESQLPLIPVDLAAEQLAHMVSNPNPTPGRLRTYHLSGAHVPVRTLLQRSLEEFGIRTEIFPMPKFLVPQPLVSKLGIPKELLDYMYSKCHFAVDHILHDYPELDTVSFHEFAPAMYAWAKENA